LAHALLHRCHRISGSVVRVASLPPIEPHPDSNYVRLATSKSYRERQEKVAWLEALSAEHDGEGCREWPWAKTADGYGIIRWDGRSQRVGHVVLALAGRPRRGLDQLHSCDNPPCCAPWHLRWGTDLDNTRDAISRGRRVASPGSRNGLAKLTEADVLVIRSAGCEVTTRSLALEYGVHETTLGKIRNGKTWRQA
jgi:hypothetical protein